MTFLLLLLSLYISHSQEILRLNPKKAYELASRNNKELIKLKHQIEAMYAEYTEAKNYFLPTIYLGGGIIYSSQGDWDKPFGLNLVSLLYEFKRTSSRINAALLRLKMKEEALRQLDRDIKIRILELFAEANLYKKLTEVKREEMAIAYVRFDRARQSKELGLTTNLEVYKLESVYRGKRKDLLLAQYEYNKVLLELKKLTGIDMYALIDVEDVLFEPEHGSIDVKKLLDYAMENNPLLKIKNIELSLYDEMIKEADSRFAARLQLRGEIGSTIRAGILQTRAYRYGWRAGVELIIPLFDPSSPFKVDSLMSQKRVANVEMNSLIEDFKLISNSADYKYSYLLAQLEEAKARDKYMEENLTLRRSEYELELAFDLGYAMAEKSEAERKLMQAKYDLLLFLARLYSFAGLDPYLILENKNEFIRAD